MSITKKLINTVECCVDDNLQGFVSLNPGLRILKGHRVVVRADYETVKAAGKVAIVSGGGSGHEPTHAGFIGPGMLTASTAGSVFASPPPNSILAAIRCVGKDNPAGVLVILGNYTGDRLTFGIAMEHAIAEGLKVASVTVGEDCALQSVNKATGKRGLAGGILVMKHGGVLLVVKNYTGDRINFGIASERAKTDGIKVEMVVVGEDCAMTSTDKTAGRRGLCGTLFIHKIAGSLAEQGRPLEEIVFICNQTVQDMGTLGVSLSPCSLPGSGPSFSLNPDEMELGLGVHGEAGVKRMKVLPANEVVKIMLQHMTNTDNVTHMTLNEGDRMALLLNNLGGTSVMEQNIIAKEIIQQLESRGVVVERAYAGHFITSLEMAGISISLLHLDDTRRHALDAATLAPAWPKPYLPPGEVTRVTPTPLDIGADTATQVYNTGVEVSAVTSSLIGKALRSVCDCLITNEETLNKLDSRSGDGDCGSSLKTGAQAILLQLCPESSPGLPTNKPHSLLMTLASVVEQSMGGSSGAMYSLFLTAAGRKLIQDVDPSNWANALQAGIQAITKYGGAEPGDRTMLDALQAAYVSLVESAPIKDPGETMRKAAMAADEGAESTRKMAARAGRASYVHPDNLTQPDPGAYAVAIWFNALADALN